MLLYVLYLSGPSCPVWVQHGGVYLPKAKLAASLAGQSDDVFSSRNTGSVSRGRRCNVASGWCITLRQEDILTIHRSPSCAVALATVSHRFNNRLLDNKQ